MLAELKHLSHRVLAVKEIVMGIGMEISLCDNDVYKKLKPLGFSVEAISSLISGRSHSASHKCWLVCDGIPTNNNDFLNPRHNANNLKLKDILSCHGLFLWFCD